MPPPLRRRTPKRIRATASKTPRWGLYYGGGHDGRPFLFALRSETCMTTQERAPLLDRERLAELLARGIDDEVAASAWQLIAAARRVLLLAHEHPDPDALGSALGLAHTLRPLGKECV